MKAWVMFMALGFIIVEAREQVITLGVRFVCDTWIVEARSTKNHTTPLRDYLQIFLNNVELYLQKSECPKIKLFLTGVNETTKEDELIFEKTDTEGKKNNT
uniref:Putative secreted protein n=1 Tax=Ixodes ricinus TaxID=34613 RepID=A0A6B0UGZ9_IXORI